MEYTKSELVPLPLYRRLMKAEDNKVDYVSPKQPKIMKQSLPDDAKILLYSDAVKDLNAKLAQRRKMPIFMEQKQTEEVDRTPRMLSNNKTAIAIYEYLKQQNIQQNDKGEVNVQGNIVPDSHLPTVIRALMNVHMGSVPGMKEVLYSLPFLMKYQLLYSESMCPQ